MQEKREATSFQNEIGEYEFGKVVMKNKRKHFLLVEGRIFPFDTLITTACTQKIINYIEFRKNYKLNDEEKDKLEMKSSGRTVMLRRGQTIVRLSLVKTKIGIDVADLAHEIEHAAFLLFDRIGIQHTHESDEVFAYYQAFLMREAMLFFDEQMGKKL